MAKVKVSDTGELAIAKTITLRWNVGILPEDANQPHGDSDLTLGEVAMINEIGNSAINLPARPWLRGWAGRHTKPMVDKIRRQLMGMVRSQKFTPAGLERIAKEMQKSMQAEILGGSLYKRNAASTLQGKKPETRPLIDTKQLVDNIHARMSASGTTPTGGKKRGANINWKYKA